MKDFATLSYTLARAEPPRIGHYREYPHPRVSRSCCLTALRKALKRVVSVGGRCPRPFRGKRVRFVVSRVIVKKFSHAHTSGELVGSPFSFPEPTICSVSGGIVGLWYQPLPDVVKFTTSGSACLIR